MDLNNLEKGDLNHLQNFEMNFDKEAIWKNVEQPKNNRSLFGWIFVASTLILFSLIYAIGNDNTNNSNEKHIPSIENQKIEAATKTESKSKLASNPKTEVNEAYFSNPQAAQEKSTIEIPENKQGSSKSPQFTDKSQKVVTNNVIKNNGKENIIVSKIGNIPFQNEAEISLPKKAMTADTPINFVEALTIEPLPHVESCVKLQSKTTRPYLNAKQTKIVIENSTSFLLSPFIGAGSAMNSYQLKRDETSFSPNSHTSQFESWSVGLLLDVKIKNNLMIGTGLEYIQHNEQFEISMSQTDEISSFKPEEIPAEYQDQDGFLTKRTTNKFQNRYRLFNIPLTLSWMFPSKKLRLAPYAGIVFNLSQNATGNIQDDTELIVDVNSYFKNNTSVGYRFGCKLYYPLSARTLIFVNPQLDIAPTDITTQINPLVQRRNLAMLNIGLAMKIHRNSLR